MADDYIIEEKIDEEVESFISVLTNTSQSKHFQDLINRNSGLYINNMISNKIYISNS